MSKKRYTLDELAALERDEPMEFSFRDGYARGYQAALDDVYGLMDAGNSKKKTRKYCKKFLSEELAAWLYPRILREAYAERSKDYVLAP